jgi:hypothetical protein
VIYPNADVYACEMRRDLKMGNLNEYDFNLKKLMRTRKNKKLAKQIMKSNCFCTYECQLTSNVAYNPKELLKTAATCVNLKLGGK